MLPNKPPETEPQIFTATMAEVYMVQGYYAKAVEIYRHLLSLEPGRRDLADFLAAAQEALRQGRVADRERLVALFARWFELAAACGRLGAINRLRRYVVGDE